MLTLKAFKKNLFAAFGLMTFILASSVSEAAPKWKKIISNSSGGSLQGGFMEFNQDSTWTVPTGVTKIQVMVIGGGGGGGAGVSGGGGGGGSCVKNGSTVLISANGGNGGDSTKFGLPGGKVQESLTVTPGTVLNLYVGGGGGGAFSYMDSSYNSYYASGAGGYGACGVGGNGGTTGAYAGGAGGSNKGGGSGAAGTRVGVAATSATGADLIYFSSAPGSVVASTGGLATAGGTSSSGGGGGGSGGIGGCYSSQFGGFASSSIGCWNNTQISKQPGEPGHFFSVAFSYGGAMGAGGGPGVIYIWW